MSRWLLAAEADQIQDCIFRSSRLREVVGGSQLLMRFCEEVPSKLGIPSQDIVVSGGGSFRLLFDSFEYAVNTGAMLAEVYWQATDGVLSVARPVEVTDDNFAHASEKAERYLREAKRRRGQGRAIEQMPYVAFCASCGVGLAVTHAQQYHGDTRGNYMCQACQKKTAERYDGKFLRPFVKKIGPVDTLLWPGKERQEDTQKRDPLSDVACYDPRNYVAYMLADGNGMGKVFNQCTREQMHTLSQKLEDTIRTCLAETTLILTTSLREATQCVDIPVLPLILGGDDLFALIPAPWALHFAATFCQKYEELVTRLVHDVFGTQRGDIPSRMTCGVAVVICKKNYPYRLAHQVGEQHLHAAKQLSKVYAYETKSAAPHSVLDFEIIVGSQQVSSRTDGAYRSTMRPYWISATDADIDIDETWGISFHKLIDARYKLRWLPGKRQAQLRDLYAIDTPTNKIDYTKRWQPQKRLLLERIDQSSNQEKLTQFWQDLDGEGYRTMQRGSDETWCGAALPDILDAWDFLYDMNKPRAAYEEA